MGYILVGTIIGGIIWGVVVNKVIENKGYEENWFWWGFFFGIFALIIALTKQSVNTTKVVIESSAPIKENMELLSSCILNNQANISSPVHIASWEIKKDTEKLVLFVDFINVSHKAISAVMFSATGFNAFGDIVRVNDADLFDVMGQDLSIKPNECGRVYAALQDDAIRKVELKVKKVCFADGTIVDNIQDEWVNTNQFELNSIHIDCARRENAQSKYYAIIKEGYWQCVCGFVNTQSTCAICGMQKNNAIKYTQDNIDGTYDEYIKQIEREMLEEEKRQIKEKQLQEEQQARVKKTKKIFAYSTGIITICVVIIMVLNAFVIPNYKYNKATKLMENKKYEESMALFSELGNYKDSIEQTLNCENAIKEINYTDAVSNMKTGNYKEAIAIFETIVGYKDTSILLENCYSEIINAGDIYRFGSYEQDNNFANGKELIEWKVLKVKEGKALLVSNYCLDCKTYNEVYEYTTWETCSIRKWLNDIFLNDAFSASEKSLIIQSQIENRDNLTSEGGNDTTDYIFLLSVDEVETFLVEDTTATPYCLAVDERNEKRAREGVVNWWLRGPGGYHKAENLINNASAAYYHLGRAISSDIFGCDNIIGIRPAMWISIE